jgi:CMP-N-acetylneuraminic acid synthetase
MKHLAIIPARGGSKRLPRKNLLPLGGKPLVAHTLEAATGSGLFETVLLSSDDPEILAAGAGVPGVVCERREAELAGDQAKAIEVVRTICRRDDISTTYDTVCLLLPTCPFRTADDLRQGIQLLRPKDYSVVSISTMKSPPQLSVGLDEASGLLNPEILLRPSSLITGMTRSQDFRPYYVVNGGFYFAWMKKFLQGKNFFSGPVRGYRMDDDRSVDIDDAKDLAVARFLLDQGFVKI